MRNESLGHRALNTNNLPHLKMIQFIDSIKEKRPQNRKSKIYDVKYFSLTTKRPVNSSINGPTMLK